MKREALTFPDVKKNWIFNYAELDPERLNIEESTTNWKQARKLKGDAMEKLFL